ncbi:DUF397 domain-containing protein [Streptomyces sp. NPDC047070]|uniref:DUF397 domain-containing protein n=1 Tax=Streptomyces sp. NPDC047070 TaxID=3154923 RepID=UPI0034514BD8
MSATELNWFKSSYSSSGSGDCVEIALSWHKSSYSSGSGDDCVEMAVCPDLIHVRDSKAQAGPQLAVTPSAWTSFLAYAVSG